MEKNIMKPADIWTTLRLPTRVKPRRPTFSLQFTMSHDLSMLTTVLQFFSLKQEGQKMHLHQYCRARASTKHTIKQNANSL